MNWFFRLFTKEKKESKYISLLFTRKPFSRVNEKEFLDRSNKLLNRVSDLYQYSGSGSRVYFFRNYLKKLRKEIELGIESMEGNLDKLNGFEIMFDSIKTRRELCRINKLSYLEAEKTIKRQWGAFERREYSKPESFLGKEFKDLDSLIFRTEKLLKASNLKREVTQLDDTLKKSYFFFKILKEKFATEGLTFFKYQGMIFEVIKNVTKNLSIIGSIETTWDFQSLPKIEEELRNLNSVKESEIKEKKGFSLNGKIELLREEKERKELLYIKNEEVLIEFGKVLIELTKIETTDEEKERKTEELIFNLRQSIKLLEKLDVSRLKDPVNFQK